MIIIISFYYRYCYLLLLFLSPSLLSLPFLNITLWWWWYYYDCYYDYYHHRHPSLSLSLWICFGLLSLYLSFWFARSKKSNKKIRQNDYTCWGATSTLFLLLNHLILLGFLEEAAASCAFFRDANSSLRSWKMQWLCLMNFQWSMYISNLK